MWVLKQGLVVCLPKIIKLMFVQIVKDEKVLNPR